MRASKSTPRVLKYDDWNEPLRCIFVPDTVRKVRSKKARVQEKQRAVAYVFDALF